MVGCVLIADGLCGGDKETWKSKGVRRGAGPVEGDNKADPVGGSSEVLEFRIEKKNFRIRQGGIPGEALQ